ncbi:methylmalonyl-CoA mutase family protein [Nocardioides sp.]|uniref:methylmalonyl-CoA mutase family protein n=1 Tax=Nocardioides sp. TaxID=35761 RepID=UPI002726D247|nr:methylmalonyl-CoA mutase family protein [Nocardioides sp.]MDO9458487.1 methylmalonyl-CoA mutase family protein [Nocardioides sp.]
MTTEGTAVEGGLDEPTELEPEQGTLDLAQPDDRHTRADWERETAKVLRKARRMTDDDPDDLVWDKLTRTTLDGIALPPLGTPDLLDDLQTAGRPSRAGDWDIRSHLAAVAAGSEKALNEEVLGDLEGGVTSVWVGATPGTDFGALLEGVFLDLAPVVLDPTGDPADPAATARAFLTWAGDLELHAATNLGAPAFDDEVAKLARTAGVLGFVVDATTIHDRGASDAQELGWSMAAAATYLRAADGAGLSVADAAALVEFRYAVTDEQFTGIAKLRAARRLWARVQELSGSEPVPMRLHAVTSRPMMTRYDPWVNMLRTTVAAFAAGAGGADAVTVLSFDSALGRPDAFGRRIARNTSHLLISEAHVAQVADPAGGAYAVEKLTDDLAAAAWTVLGELEDGGEGEAWEAAIADVVAAREKQVATRKRPLTGLSEFPHLAETLPERDGDGLGVASYGASFEALRDDPPAAHVFLATLGTVAAHTARATFATNLFAAGGVAVDVAGATDGVDALVAAYDGQPVVCLAGADAAYAEWGEAAASALREAGATRVVVAGKPTDYSDDACAMGVDALAFLARTREALS